MRFDFNEANILKQNLYDPRDNRAILLKRLDSVFQNTTDSVLRKSVRGLIKKIEVLSDDDVRLIYKDIVSKKFLVTSYYKVVPKSK